ncbi:MAG: hypothetical protein QOI99_759, partial [Actinomycetota bacterium]|nr:hypothetical protein [Actinomycetota bacterium]
MLLAGGYLGVALLTSWLTGRPIRPLFDGFAPPAAYQWVKPPRELASTNVVPKETIVSVLLGPDGNQPASVSSGDGQFALNLPAGAVPAAEGQSTAQSTAEDQSTAPSTAQSTAEGQSTAPSTAPTTAPSTAPSTAQTTAEGQSTAPPTAPSTAQATATFTLTPLDAGTLAPLPGLFADGNAYRV